MGHPVVTVDLRGHGRSSKPDDGVRRAHGRRRPRGADRAHGPRPARRRRAVVGRQRRARAGGAAPTAVRGDRPASTAAGSSRRRASPTGRRASRRWPHPASRAGRCKEIEGYIRSAHADWPETGIQGTLGNFEVLPDGTIAPWLTFDRHLVVLRGLWEHHPAALYAGLKVPVLLVPADDGTSDWSDRKRREVEAAQAAIPHARMHWITGDHDLHAQHPARTGSDADWSNGQRWLTPMSDPRILAIMGSGETAPTMAKVHRSLLDRLGDPAAPAALDRHAVRLPGERGRAVGSHRGLLRRERRAGR